MKTPNGGADKQQKSTTALVPQMQLHNEQNNVITSQNRNTGAAEQIVFNGVTNGSGVALADNSAIPVNNVTKPMTPLLYNNEKQPYSANRQQMSNRNVMGHGGVMGLGGGGTGGNGGGAVASEHIVTPQGQSYSKGQQQLTQNFSRMKVSSGNK